MDKTSNGPGAVEVLVSFPPYLKVPEPFWALVLQQYIDQILGFGRLLSICPTGNLIRTNMKRAVRWNTRDRNQEVN